MKLVLEYVLPYIVGRQCFADVRNTLVLYPTCSAIFTLGGAEPCSAVVCLPPCEAWVAVALIATSVGAATDCWSYTIHKLLAAAQSSAVLSQERICNFQPDSMSTMSAC